MERLNRLIASKRLLQQNLPLPDSQQTAASFNHLVGAAE
jgi:hypothetical protein